jgi:MiaB/RimO family radical SAM methylthiotransferase
MQRLKKVPRGVVLFPQMLFQRLLFVPPTNCINPRYYSKVSSIYQFSDTRHWTRSNSCLICSIHTGTENIQKQIMVPLQDDVTTTAKQRRIVPNDGLTFHDFVKKHQSMVKISESNATLFDLIVDENNNTDLLDDTIIYTFSIKTYGCQMNVSDTEIVRSVLLATGKFKEVSWDPITCTNEDDDNNINHNNSNCNNNSNELIVEPDIYLTNTCAIREGAEQKVITRLQQLRALNRQKRKKLYETKAIIGVLGCMAERLKDELLKDDMADLVVGPDAYRALPQLLLNLLLPSNDDRRQHAINVQLSMDETYADIIPIRRNNDTDSISAFVSIQRGCSNRCSFCIVPFTRGIERSRPIHSIVEEVKRLHYESGINEVTLLGQNVNSYHDQCNDMATTASTTTTITKKVLTSYQLSNSGFKSRIQRSDHGYFFTDLLEAVADINPHQLRVRFTSPHPKDFPAPLLQLMSERSNICNHIHMPAQSGSSTVLKRMKRGYTREAYLQLIDDVRITIPDVALSSDFIAGFCKESDEEHADTISLLQHVQYDQAYMFAYSRRDGTHAARTMDDNVPEDIKQRRLREIIDTYQTIIHIKNKIEEVGRLRLVLVEGATKKRSRDNKNSNNSNGLVMWNGRTDQNKRILFSVEDQIDPDDNNDNVGIPCWNETDVRYTMESLQTQVPSNEAFGLRTSTGNSIPNGRLRKGDYAVIQVTEARGHTLRGKLCWKSESITSFEELGLMRVDDNNQIREVFVRNLFT